MADADSGDEFLEDLMATFRSKPIDWMTPAVSSAVCRPPDARGASEPATSERNRGALKQNSSALNAGPTASTVSAATASAVPASESTAIAAPVSTSASNTGPPGEQIRGPGVTARRHPEWPILYKLSTYTNAGRVLQHAQQEIQHILDLGLTVFKIGATTNPEHRWSNARFGYCRDRDFHCMRVLACVQTGEGMAFLEASLISAFKRVPGCRNEALGGDNVPMNSTSEAGTTKYYVYVVYRHLPVPPKRKLAL